MAEILFDTLDQLPEELREFAKNRDDGKVIVNLVPKTRLDEFREKNTELLKEKEKTVSRLDTLSKIIGEDEAKFVKDLEELRKTKQLVDDGKLDKSENIESILSERTRKMREAHDEELRRIAGEASEWRKQHMEVAEVLKGVQIDNYIRSAIHDQKSGARVEAEPHILLEARKVFKIEGEKIVPKNGDSTIYGEDGANPMSPIEWMKSLQKQMPYLFKDSTGGGAGGGGMPGFGNLTREDIAKLSPQQKLELANKQKALGKK